MKRAAPLCSNVRPALLQGHEKQEETNSVEYATVIFNRDSCTKVSSFSHRNIVLRQNYSSRRCLNDRSGLSSSQNMGDDYSWPRLYQVDPAALFGPTEYSLCYWSHVQFLSFCIWKSGMPAVASVNTCLCTEFRNTARSEIIYLSNIKTQKVIPFLYMQMMCEYSYHNCPFSGLIFSKFFGFLHWKSILVLAKLWP